MRCMHDYENPIDIWIVDNSSWLVTLLREDLGFTPNGVTILSIVFSILAIASLWYRHLALFVLLSAIAYWMDDLDGVMARKYKLTSKIGEILDHASDALYFVGVYLVLVVRFKALSKMPVVMILLLLSSLIPTIHYACASRVCSGDGADGAIGALNRTLLSVGIVPTDTSKADCLAHALKYFGGGSYQIFLYVAVVLIATHADARRTMARMD